MTKYGHCWVRHCFELLSSPVINGPLNWLKVLPFFCWWKLACFQKYIICHHNIRKCFSRFDFEERNLKGVWCARKSILRITKSDKKNRLVVVSLSVMPGKLIRARWRSNTNLLNLLINIVFYLFFAIQIAKWSYFKSKYYNLNFLNILEVIN